MAAPEVKAQVIIDGALFSFLEIEKILTDSTTKERYILRGIVPDEEGIVENYTLLYKHGEEASLFIISEQSNKSLLRRICIISASYYEGKERTENLVLSLEEETPNFIKLLDGDVNEIADRYKKLFDVDIAICLPPMENNAENI